MRQRFPVLMLVCLTLLGCDADPASKVKIIARPTLPPGSPPSAANPAAPAFIPFRPELCAVRPEPKAGSSRFVLEGPCAFRHQGNVRCRDVLDDFHTVFLRHGPGDATVSMYLNIEFYKGTGSYDGGQMFVTVQTGSSYYHWGSDSVRTTIGPGLRYVDIQETRLEAEPPNTGTEIVSGRFWCADPNDTTTLQ